MTEHRLSPLTILLAVVQTAAWSLLVAIPTALVLAIVWTPWAVLGVLGLVVVLVGIAALGSWLTWRHTSWTVGPEHFVLRSGVFKRTTRTFARNRIRAIDLSAGPIQRIFGLAAIHIGTAEQTGDDGSAVLSPVDREEAKRLQAELLPRGGADAKLLGRFSPGWLVYAPLSWVPLVIAAGVYGIAGQFAEGFGELAWDWATGTAARTGWGVIIAVLVGVPLVVGVVGSLLIHAELWWNHRLERDSGVLQVRRGLLTSRTVSLPEERLRGVRVSEPLGVRLAGAAQLEALAIGLKNQRSDGGKEDLGQSNVLLPYAPRDVVDGVAAKVLEAPVAATDPERLVPHPRQAFLRRRLRVLWVLLVWLLATVPLVVLLLPRWWWAVAVGVVLLGAAGLWLAWDGWRSLGHRLDDEHLVARSGSLLRATDALERDAIIGWNVRQSFFQRRRGLVTLEATTGAGSGAVGVVDVGSADGIALADAATPGLLTPFLATSSPAPAPR
ncbi:hypothetical protein GCM10028820_18340 [Tessaracoccus terricola]